MSGRDALLTAALKRFAAVGYQAASLRCIADDANVDMALIRRLFGSKAGLWNAMIENLASSESRKRQTASLADRVGSDVRTRMELLIDFIVDLCIELPVFPGLLLHEATVPSDRMEFLFRDIVYPFNEVAIPLVEHAIREGIVAATDPHIFFIFLMNAVSLSLAAPHYMRALGSDPAMLAIVLKTNAKMIFLR
jgi:AcrR family transcriptional regulator